MADLIGDPLGIAPAWTADIAHVHRNECGVIFGEPGGPDRPAARRRTLELLQGTVAKAVGFASRSGGCPYEVIIRTYREAVAHALLVMELQLT